jgi:hypothetical protein
MALRRLVGLSPAHAPGAMPLTREELKAKATVLRVLELEADDLTEDERVYVRFFARGRRLSERARGEKQHLRAASLRAGLVLVLLEYRKEAGYEEIISFT